jgi:hypothetical protein
MYEILLCHLSVARRILPNIAIHYQYMLILRAPETLDKSLKKIQLIFKAEKIINEILTPAS